MVESFKERIAALILDRSWFRSDRIWTSGLLFRRPFSQVPFFMDRWALSRSRSWTREQLDTLTARRLEILLKEIAHVPLWKDVFNTHARGSRTAREYLKTLPVISRAIFKELAPDAYISRTHVQGSIRDTTSGSTGVPFMYFLDRGTLLAIRALRDRDFTDAAGGEYPIILFRADSIFQMRFRDPRFVYLRSLFDIPTRFDALAEAFAAHAPNGGVLYTFPSVALALARFMEQNDKTLPVRLVTGAGESVSQTDRELMERVFKAPYKLLYSSLEISGIAFECEYGRMHVNEEDMYVEIVDDHGSVVEAGMQGRIVITMFGYRVMPFVRYHNGDIGSLSDEPCPCGRAHRTLSLFGRVPTLIHQKDGYTITLTELAAQLNAHPGAVTTYQIVHHAPTVLSIYIVPGSDYDSLREQIEGRVLRKLHPDTRVSFVLVQDIPASNSGKARYYIKEF